MLVMITANRSELQGQIVAVDTQTGLALIAEGVAVQVPPRGAKRTKPYLPTKRKH